MLKYLKAWLSYNSVLGLNSRNKDFIYKINSTQARKLANSKIKTKLLLQKNGIQTSDLYKIIKSQKDLENLDWSKLPKSFVLKPNSGAYGAGILVFYGKRKKVNEWIQTDLSILNKNEIESHIYNILTGKYSKNNKKDYAFLEERITNHPDLKPYSQKGIPDIRVIVFNNVPIMAQLRLPTLKSKGKSNIHAGGICVGIDIATGITTNAITNVEFDLLGDQYKIIETTIDEPYLPLRGISIPYWDKILQIAVKCQQITEIGYLGADIAIDRDKGPVVMELNISPGLAIQVANQAGLRERLEKVKKMKIKTISKGIRVAKTLFGGEIEEEIENISGRHIIGFVEKITLNPFNDLTKKHKLKPEQVKAKIDTGALSSSLSYKLALRLGYSELLKLKEIFSSTYEDNQGARDKFQEIRDSLVNFTQIKNFTIIRAANGVSIRPIIEVSTIISGEKETLKFTVGDRDNLHYQVIIGRSDLKNFLIDTTKTFVLH